MLLNKDKGQRLLHIKNVTVFAFLFIFFIKLTRKTLVLGMEFVTKKRRHRSPSI
jgi:hypothetical protein